MNHVTHQDLKLDNILFINGHFKISDFGAMVLHKSGDYLTRAHTGAYFIKSPSCLAALKREITYDAQKNDLWAWGLLVLHMALGRFPLAEEYCHQVQAWDISYFESALDRAYEEAESIIPNLIPILKQVLVFDENYCDILLMVRKKLEPLYIGNRFNSDPKIDTQQSKNFRTLFFSSFFNEDNVPHESVQQTVSSVDQVGSGKEEIIEQNLSSHQFEQLLAKAKIEPVNEQLNNVIFTDVQQAKDFVQALHNIGIGNRGMSGPLQSRKMQVTTKDNTEYYIVDLTTVELNNLLPSKEEEQKEKEKLLEHHHSKTCNSKSSEQEHTSRSNITLSRNYNAT